MTKIKLTNNKENDLAHVTGFRGEVIYESLGSHVEDTLLFPLDWSLADYSPRFWATHSSRS